MFNDAAGLIASDETGSYNGDLVGGVGWASDNPFGVTGDTSVSFNGIDSYVDIDDNFFNTANRTVSLWFKADAVQTDSPARLFSGGTGVPNRWYMWIRDGDDIESGVGSNAPVELDVNYVADEWMHYVLTYDGTAAVSYINGVQVLYEENNTKNSFCPNDTFGQNLIY